MFSTTVTDTGQITIPQEIQDYLKLSSGSKIDFVIDEDGHVKLIPLNVSVEKLSGFLHRPGIRKSTLEEMEVAISEGANDWT
ncbi:AbrB/MazE/SpoVT family DNA-binding domain-containing protein [Coleofasciculus sp. F4-SAH-05]|jgi:AbrB family looped-hinge helix DNA binding protein|uniref:AbrB/MazE/SpoVT family DNA-binding domain-containing protein n=1 Tax=Coleofasciculus TaxID=669368 RepID=UPI0032FF497E